MVTQLSFVEDVEAALDLRTLAVALEAVLLEDGADVRRQLAARIGRAGDLPRAGITVQMIVLPRIAKPISPNRVYRIVVSSRS